MTPDLRPAAELNVVNRLAIAHFQRAGVASATDFQQRIEVPKDMPVRHVHEIALWGIAGRRDGCACGILLDADELPSTKQRFSQV
jgi:hypothetical protein